MKRANAQEPSAMVHHDQQVHARCYHQLLPAARLLWVAGEPGLFLPTGEVHFAQDESFPVFRTACVLICHFSISMAAA